MQAPFGKVFAGVNKLQVSFLYEEFNAVLASIMFD